MAFALLAWRVWGGADMKNNRAADFGSHGAWGAVLFDVFTEKPDWLGSISQTRNFPNMCLVTHYCCKQNSGLVMS